MTIWDTLSKAVNPRAWVAASSRSFELRNNMAHVPPFDRASAVQMYNSWIYAAATINANAVASTPLRLFVRSSNVTRRNWSTRRASRKSMTWLRGDGARNPSPLVMRKAAELGADFEEMTDEHPLLRLLATANPWFNGYDATVLRVIWQELTGNAYQHVIFGPLGTPTELWPMPPQWTKVIPDAERFISGYKYGRASESETTLSTDEVLHFRRPNPRDLFYGMGKLEAAYGAALANAALHAMDLSMFQNNARPDALITIKGNASSDEIERIEKSIRGKFRGTSSHGRFMVSTADIDYKPLSFPPKDLAGREEIVEEIAAVFGVPVSMLKANDPNLSGATVGFASWREMTVLPLCRMDEETLNQRLLPMFGIEGDAVLAYDDPVPLNRQLELSETQVAVAGGWLTPNEARERAGFPPITDDPMADRLLVNGQPLGGPPPGAPMLASADDVPEIAAFLGAVPVAPAPPMLAAAAPIADTKSMRACCATHEKCMTQSGLWMADGAGVQTKAAPEKLVNAELLEKFLVGVEGVLRDQVAAVVKQILADGAPTPDTVARAVAVLERGNWNRILVDALQPYLAAAMNRGADIGFASLSKLTTSTAVANLGWSSAELSAYVERASVRLATRAADAINTHTATRLRDMFGDGLTAGDNVGQLAARVQDWAVGEGDDVRATRARATMIARTEAARAAVTAESDAWKSTGLVKAKRWLLAPDPCEFCEAAAAKYGTNGVPLDDSFFGKGSTLAGADGGRMKLDYAHVDGPPLHPNCRCAMQPTLVDDYENIAAEAERRIAASNKR